MNTDLQPGDRQFLELIEANRLRLLKICRVYARNEADRDDLYQEIQFQIWRSLPKLKQSALANTWIYRTALNTAISFVRKRARRADKTTSYDQQQLGELVEQGQSHTPSAHDPLTALYEAIAKLDEVEKALITLFLEDLSYEEIAEVMGISSGNVGVSLHRVKKKLSTLMKEASHE